MCPSCRESRSGRVLVLSALTPPSHTAEEAEEALEAQRGERTGQPSQLGAKVPEGRLFSSCCLTEQPQVLLGFLWLLLGVHRAWELLGPDVVGLPESRLAGAESPASLPQVLTSASWPSSTTPSLCCCPYPY